MSCGNKSLILFFMLLKAMFGMSFFEESLSPVMGDFCDVLNQF